MADTPDEQEAVGAEVLSLDAHRERHEYHGRIVAAAGSGRTPEPGQRTPQATVTRWTRADLVDLTIGDLHIILREGEQGQTKRMADLWLRMLKTDSHLASVWISRIAPVASARWELSPGEGPEDTAPAARRLRDACEEALRGLGNLEPVFTRQLGGLGPGYSVSEIIWGRMRLLGVPAWAPSKVKPIHSRRFQFSDTFEIGLSDEGTAPGRIEAEGFEVTTIVGRGGALARLPAGKYIVHQPPGIDDYPTATGLVHPISRWWWAKQRCVVYSLGGAELAGNPRIIGKLIDQGDPDAAQALLEGLEKLAADGVGIFRAGVEVQLIPPGAQSGNIWESLIKMFDAAMSKAVLGSTLNVEVGDSGGNRSLGESQSETTIDPRKEMDGAQLWSTWRDQVFRFIRSNNPHLFPPDTPLPVGAFIFAEPAVEVDQLMIDSGWLKVDQLLTSRGLPLLGGEAGDMFIPRKEDPATRFSQPRPPVAEAPEVATAEPPFPRASMSALTSMALAKGRATLATSDVTQMSFALPPTKSVTRPSGS